MYETQQELSWLQDLLDTSHASAGSHLRSIFTEERRVPAADLAEMLFGVKVLNIATVTTRGEPRVAPVDGLFFRARFYFGSSPTSARFRHLRARPAVSASYTHGEELAVLVHGTAAVLDMSAESAFRAFLIETYGMEWETWGADASYARIDPHAMFTFRFAGE